MPSASFDTQDTESRASTMSLYVLLVLLSEICQVATGKKTSDIIQDSGVMTADVGQTVTLKCVYEGNDITFFSWYQQRLGGQPFSVSFLMKNKKNATISPPFSERFQVEGGNKRNHLKISDLRLSDSATYYCGVLEFSVTEFGPGVFLHVKASLSNIGTLVYQPSSEALWLGDSLNLSCTVYAEKCAGEHKLYWFRHGAAQPAIMYQNVQHCMTESHATNCTSYFSIKSAKVSDAGMYYCALASCGEVAIGNGTRVDVAGDSKVTTLLVYCLGVALAVFSILLLVLAFFMNKLKKQMCSICKGRVSHLACPAAPEAMSFQGQDADVHYAALSLTRTSRRYLQKETESVYTRVRTAKE